MKGKRYEVQFSHNPYSSRYSQIEDPTEVRRLLQQAQDHRATLWLKSKSLMIRGTMSDDDDLKKSFSLQLSDLGFVRGLQKALGIQSPQEGYVLLTLGGGGLLGFKTSILSVDLLPDSLGKVVFAPPTTVFLIQRRKEPRYKIPRGYEVHVSYRNPLRASDPSEPEIVTYRLLDISESGCSVLIPKESLKKYQKAMILHEVKIVLRGRPVLMDAVVRTISLKSSDPKMGLKFYRMDAKDSDYLSQYVVEHAIQYMN